MMNTYRLVDTSQLKFVIYLFSDDNPIQGLEAAHAYQAKNPRQTVIQIFITTSLQHQMEEKQMRNQEKSLFIIFLTQTFYQLIQMVGSKTILIIELQPVFFKKVQRNLAAYYICMPDSLRIGWWNRKMHMMCYRNFREEMLVRFEKDC